ncbi:MAG: hypothetical protein AAFN92_17505, partial [Bacteroidota bacterium]
MRYLLLLLLFGLLFTACGDENTPTETTTPAPERAMAPAAAPEKVPSYLTQTVSKETVARPILLTGRVVPMQEATVASQVPGIVLPTDKLLQEGKYYRQGETMVRIDDEQLRYGLRAERSKLVTSLVRILSDLSIDYPAAHPTWERFTNSIKA